MLDTFRGVRIDRDSLRDYPLCFSLRQSFSLFGLCKVCGFKRVHVRMTKCKGWTKSCRRAERAQAICVQLFIVGFGRVQVDKVSQTRHSNVNIQQVSIRERNIQQFAKESRWCHDLWIAVSLTRNVFNRSAKFFEHPLFERIAQVSFLLGNMLKIETPIWQKEQTWDLRFLWGLRLIG